MPLKPEAKNILLTGPYVEKIAMGGGSAKVLGFNNRTILDALTAEFGDRINHVESPTEDQSKQADVVLCNVGTSDSEGSDRAFALPEEQEQSVRRCVKNNPNTVVIVTSGSGIRMTDWNGQAAAILYAWYGGQIGNVALAVFHVLLDVVPSLGLAGGLVDGRDGVAAALPVPLARRQLLGLSIQDTGGSRVAAIEGRARRAPSVAEDPLLPRRGHELVDARPVLVAGLVVGELAEHV